MVRWTLVRGEPSLSPRILAAIRALIIGTVIGILVFGVGFAAYGMLTGSEIGRSLGQEDGPFELVGAAAFALAAILQAVLFWRSDVPVHQRLFRSLRRNPFHLGLAIALFFAFAEEISWGQRIVGWATPDAFMAANAQDETNIHNLAPFQGGGSLLNMHRLGNIFWLSYCVLLPLAVVASLRLRSLAQRVTLPVPPVWIGGLFVGCYVAFRVFILVAGGDPEGDATEVQEAFLAICFAALSIAQLAQSRTDVEVDMQALPASHRPA